jgi:hypothetical protein
VVACQAHLEQFAGLGGVAWSFIIGWALIRLLAANEDITRSRRVRLMMTLTTTS